MAPTSMGDGPAARGDEELAHPAADTAVAIVIAATTRSVNRLVI